MLILEKIADTEARQADARQTKLRFSSDPKCQTSTEATTAKLRRANETNWAHCTGIICAVWGCPDQFSRITDFL